MGEVRGDNYVKHEDKPACDGRCTHAAGPMCDCLCGGANHGTGKTVRITKIEGKVHAVGLSEEDVERAHVYRRFRDAALADFDKKFAGVGEMIRSGTYVERPLYVDFVTSKRDLEKAIAMRQHAPRIKALADLIMKLRS
jgi:hypothetical protein